MTRMEEFVNIIRTLRSEHGCPWDRRQTHSSLKASCIEEAAEVISAINILDETGDPDNLKEELGDLLLQIVMHACMAEEEGYFTLDDVIESVSEKMIRRHPHVFGNNACPDRGDELVKWEAIKAKENKKSYDPKFLRDAFNESKEFIEIARQRKGYSQE